MDLETKNVTSLSLPNKSYSGVYGVARYGISLYGDGAGVLTAETKNITTLTLEVK